MTEFGIVDEQIVYAKETPDSAWPMTGRVTDSSYDDEGPDEQYQNRMIWHAASLLESLPGWDRIPEDHRANTPVRLVQALHELTVREDFNFTTFENKGDSTEMIVLAPMPFYTMCAHHTLPFFGTAYIGYVPEGKIAGLSKFQRLVNWCAKGFWVQEELTRFLADELYNKLEPKGTAVVMRAEHLCMAMRGVQQPGVITTTSDMRGVYAQHDRLARAEFFELAGLRRN